MMKCPKAAAGKLLSIFLLVLLENSEFSRLAHTAVYFGVNSTQPGMRQSPRRLRDGSLISSSARMVSRFCCSVPRSPSSLGVAGSGDGPGCVEGIPLAPYRSSTRLVPRNAVDTATEAETCLFLPTRDNPNRPALLLRIRISAHIFRYLATPIVR
jgi:hypothetical protein